MEDREKRQNSTQQAADEEPRRQKDVPAEESSPAPDNAAPDEDALSWLDDVKTGAAPEELPTMQWPHDKDELLEAARAAKQAAMEESAAETPALENVDDAMTWLEDLALEQGETIEEMPTMLADPQTPLPSSDEPHEDPMAWLENLATAQNTPLEELPSVADRLLASEIISQVESEHGREGGAGIVPVELGIMLDYLEARAQAAGIDLSAVGVDELNPDDSLEERLSAVDRLTQPPPPAIVSPAAPSDWTDLTAQMPEDPDEALAWLSSLAEAESSPEAEQAAPDAPADSTEETPADRPPVARDPAAMIAALEDEGYFLDEMPEDPDEAMAWLERVAAEQGVVVDKAQAEQTDAVLTQAREALAAGDLDAALTYFEQALQEGAETARLLPELETAVAQYPDALRLRRLLGDAYMHAGRSDKAAEAYRQALDHL